MNNKDYKFKITKILLIIIVMLYFSFLYMDIFKIGTALVSNRLKFISMILIFIISLIKKEDALELRDIYLLQVGLFLTIFADLFLLILDNYYIIGIALFSIVQILYSIRYEYKKAKLIIKNFIIIFIVLIFIYIIINSFIVKVDLLIAISFYYAICLLTSVIKGIKVYIYEYYPTPNRQMIALGMVLFLLCDINVALYNIIEFLSLKGKFVGLLYNIFFISMWLYYLPSQVLLSISGYRYR